jgi:transposase
MRFDLPEHQLHGPAGSLTFHADDELAHKLLMLVLGECTDLGPGKAAQLFGFSRQRYYQLRQAFQEHGSAALLSHQPGPKPGSRYAHETLRQLLRVRFLDPDASADVLAQKLQQTGQPISVRGVERLIQHYGLQKKLPPLSSGRRTPGADATLQDARNQAAS